MSDVLRGGRRIRIFNVVDDRTREVLASEVDTSLPARRMIQALDEIALERGYPSESSATTGRSFVARCSMRGPTSTVSRSISFSPESRSRIRT